MYIKRKLSKELRIYSRPRDLQVRGKKSFSDFESGRRKGGRDGEGKCADPGLKAGEWRAETPRGWFEIYAAASAKSTGIKYRALALPLMSYVLFSKTNTGAKSLKAKSWKLKAVSFVVSDSLFSSYFQREIFTKPFGRLAARTNFRDGKSRVYRSLYITLSVSVANYATNDVFYTKFSINYQTFLKHRHYGVPPAWITMG